MYMRMRYMSLQCFLREVISIDEDTFAFMSVFIWAYVKCMYTYYYSTQITGTTASQRLARLHGGYGTSWK